MDTDVKYGVWFEWTDTESEWLCDRDGIVFVFDFLDEAEAIAVLLHPGDGVAVEAREYDGDRAVRPYPWDGGQATLEDLIAWVRSTRAWGIAVRRDWRRE